MLQSPLTGAFYLITKIFNQLLIIITKNISNIVRLSAQGNAQRSNSSIAIEVLIAWYSLKAPSINFTFTNNGKF
jgi:hypothetical protein